MYICLSLNLRNLNKLELELFVFWLGIVIASLEQALRVDPQLEEVLPSSEQRVPSVAVNVCGHVVFPQPGRCVRGGRFREVPCRFVVGILGSSSQLSPVRFVRLQRVAVADFVVGDDTDQVFLVLGQVLDVERLTVGRHLANLHPHGLPNIANDDVVSSNGAPPSDSGIPHSTMLMLGPR